MPNRLRTPEEKLAILEAAKASGNAKAVCKEANLSEAVFYGWRRKFEAGGLAGLENKKRWNTHKPLPDFQIDGTDWVVKSLKRSSNLNGAALSPWYNFDLHVGDRWILRGFSYNLNTRNVRGCTDYEPRGNKRIVEPLGETLKLLKDSVEMVINLYSQTERLTTTNN